MKNYYDGLASQAISGQINAQDQGVANRLENIFTLNLKDSIVSFQNYQQKIAHEKDESIQKIKKKYIEP